MANMYYLIIFFVLMEYGISFKLTSSSYIVPKSTLLMELKLRYIKIPIQNDSSKYESLLKMQIPENQLIRWYIAKVEQFNAVLEVVYESFDELEVINEKLSSP